MKRLLEIKKGGSKIYKDFMANYSRLANIKMLVTQSCATLCDPVDCSPLGSSVHGILQARILEWVAISFSKLTLKKVKNHLVLHSVLA